MGRPRCIWIAFALAGATIGCGGESDSSSGGGGDAAGESTGGSASTGGEPSTGGSSAGTGGASGAGTGGEDTGGTSGTGGEAGCAAGCGFGTTCCDGVCRNLANDPTNCGSCGTECSSAEPVCTGGSCVQATCEAGVECTDGTCCGDYCCRNGELCCLVEQGGPVGPGGPTCYAPENGTCPIGCIGCDCAAPDTPVDTPRGPRPIAELRPGDLVYSVEHEAVVVVPIAEVVQRPAFGHVVPRVTLKSGATLLISAQHPTADGHTMGQLRPGDHLGELGVSHVRMVAYPHDHTYDILPASTTGYYFVAGALIGSTLGGEAAVCE